MSNNKGQALVEFVILIPVLVILIFSVFDLGNIIFHKYQLSNDLDYISDLYIEEKKDEIDKYVNNRKIKYQIKNNNSKINIIVSQSVKINSPGLNLVLGNYYDISVERMIYHES